MKGTVKFFNDMKGFGFIAAENGKEIFVHQSALGEGVTLHENDSVVFDIEDGDKGPKAANVKKDDGTEDSKSEEAPAKEAEESDEDSEE